MGTLQQVADRLSSDLLLRNWVDADGNRWRVELELKSIGGVESLAALSIAPTSDGYPLTQSVLRQLPLAAIEREAMRANHRALAAVHRSTSHGPHSGRPHDDDSLSEVADVYVAARNARMPVQRTVAEHFGISVSTAAKRILAARRRGLISPDTPPR